MESFQTDLKITREHTNKIANLAKMIKDGRKSMDADEIERQMILLINYCNILEKDLLKMETKYCLQHGKIKINKPNPIPNMANHLASLKAQQLL